MKQKQIEKLKQVIKKAKDGEAGIDCNKSIKWKTYPHYEDCRGGK